MGSEAFSAGDGLVFASDKPHRVERVTGNGTRRVLVVELWPFPDGHAPTRVATPQPFFAFTAPPPRSAPIALSLLPFSSSYVVLRGGLVAAGMLPVPLYSSSSSSFATAGAPPMTWSEAVDMCDRMLACLAFSFTHTTAWGGGTKEENDENGDKEEAHIDTLRLPVWFKREASPIRIKGMEASDGGASYYAQPQGQQQQQQQRHGDPQQWQWTAIKPWRLADGANGAAAESADYRECEEWALDGHCGKLPVFMQSHCALFCAT